MTTRKYSRLVAWVFVAGGLSLGISACATNHAMSAGSMNNTMMQQGAMGQGEMMHHDEMPAADMMPNTMTSNDGPDQDMAAGSAPQDMNSGAMMHDNMHNDASMHGNSMPSHNGMHDNNTGYMHNM